MDSNGEGRGWLRESEEPCSCTGSEDINVRLLRNARKSSKLGHQLLLAETHPQPRITIPQNRQHGEKREERGGGFATLQISSHPQQRG